MLTVEDYKIETKALSDKDIQTWDLMKAVDGEASGRRWLAGTIGLAVSHRDFGPIMVEVERVATSRINLIERNGVPTAAALS
jgi:hypothetical protein